MKILVTGGAGFIGSHVVDGYIREGHEVLVVDDLSSGKLENLNKSARFHKMDIRSAEVREVILRERPQIINHHAAQMSVPASVKDPSFDADVNIRGLLNILEASKDFLKKFIFISSGGAIYGDAKEYPTTESYPPMPLSPYAITKLSSEYYLNYYRHQYGLNFTVLRYSNIYGPRQIPHGEAGVVAIFMENILKNKPSNLYHFPDDQDGMTRDYCYVEDVAWANVLALEKGDGQVINIGTGKATKTYELYLEILKTYEMLTGKDLGHLRNPIRGHAREGDIPRSCLVIERAQKVLNWVPSTGLRDGIIKTWKWRFDLHGAGRLDNGH